MEEARDHRRDRNRPLYVATAIAHTPPPPARLEEALARFTPAWIAELVESGELPGIIEEARESETGARLYRQWLESLTEPDAAEPRACPVCGGPVRGRKDRRYCSDACRQKGHRMSRVKP